MSLVDLFVATKPKDSVRVALQDLKDQANPSCKKCYGRGITGRNSKTGGLIPCWSCVRKHRRKENAKVH